ncbi:MAG TPA: glycosyltransferase, partial [Caulobacteraceae bacterium]|nr:glycosyltransferase [Caulobacteraceae bacterium]
MRILLATDAWEPQVNGVVRTLTRIVAELRDLGDEVEVISPDQFPSFPLPTYPEIKLAVGAYEKVQEKFKSFEPEAIHIATEGSLGIAARRHCLRRGWRFTTSFHTKFAEYLHARTHFPISWTYAWLRRFHAASARIMVATPSLETELTQHGFLRLARWSR